MSRTGEPGVFQGLLSSEAAGHVHLKKLADKVFRGGRDRNGLGEEGTVSVAGLGGETDFDQIEDFVVSFRAVLVLQQEQGKKKGFRRIVKLASGKHQRRNNKCTCTKDREGERGGASR